jgi:hypothetical protein
MRTSRSEGGASVTDCEALASGLAADVLTGHAAHSRDSNQDHRT